MNVNEIILKIMTYEGVYTDTELSKVLGLKPSAISNWKNLGSVPKKYLRKYEGIISTIDKTSTLEQPAQDVSIINEDTHIMKENEYYYIRINNNGQWERLDKETMEVEVRIKGVWVADAAQ